MNPFPRVEISELYFFPGTNNRETTENCAQNFLEEAPSYSSWENRRALRSKAPLAYAPASGGLLTYCYHERCCCQSSLRNSSDALPKVAATW